MTDLIPNEGYEWIVLYGIVGLINWILYLKWAGEWIIKKDELVFNLTGEDWGMSAFGAIFWPVTSAVIFCLWVTDTHHVANLVGGRKPKELVEKLHEKRIDELLEEDSVRS